MQEDSHIITPLVQNAHSNVDTFAHVLCEFRASHE
jgi:hypothetical protein